MLGAKGRVRGRYSRGTLPKRKMMRNTERENLNVLFPQCNLAKLSKDAELSFVVIFYVRCD